jgi:type II secretory pathway pseudopilin PulG
MSSMVLHSQSRQRVPRRRDAGYAMLTLLLAMALVAIFAGALVSSITFDIKRDREEEMIHRGVQYSRAIRAYYKKFGRYPTKIDDLESANNLRFLRKRYKDPLTGQDFKLLRFGEVRLTMGGVLAPPTPGVSTNGSPGFSGNPNTPSGQNQQSVGNPPAGSDPSQLAGQVGPDGTPPNPSGTATDTGNGNAGDTLAGVTFGGGPIIGVASTSKKDTIREYNHKKKYNEWQFVYDPGLDRGGIITTPYQPMLMLFGQQGVQNLNGQPGNNNTFGTGSPPAGMQNNPNLPAPGGFGTSNPPSNPPQQQ